MIIKLLPITVKKNIFILLLACIVQFSCTESKTGKQAKIDDFKAEIEQLMDSSIHFYNKGVRLLKAGVAPIKIQKFIGPKLDKLRKQINEKSKEFAMKAQKLKIPRELYDNVFLDLNTNVQSIQEKHKYLNENGVKID